MADAEDPGQPMQTTEETSSRANEETDIRFDPSYLKTKPGLLKIVQVLSSILCFIFVRVSASKLPSALAYCATMSMIAFLLSLNLLGCYLFNIIINNYKIRWLKMEFLYCAVMTLLFLIASCLAPGYKKATLSAAAFFGFVATAAYGADAALKFLAVRAGAGGLALGGDQTTSATSPPTIDF